jgi:hypothetical protein
MGMAVKTDPKTPALPDTPVLYKVQTKEEAEGLVQYFLASLSEKTWKGDISQWNFFNTILMIRDYKKELCYVLYIPSDDKGLDADQPWHLKGSNELVFELKANPETIGKFYLRVYIVDLKKDKYSKFILYHGQKIKMDATVADHSSQGR